ncbi:MAG: hypothetical protein PVJ57_03120 [Phycisphaerae bacterium]
MRTHASRYFLRAGIAIIVAMAVWTATFYWVLFIYMNDGRRAQLGYVLTSLMEDTLPPALAFITALTVYHLLARRKPVEQPACPDCGYLLRGVAEPRCPECGRRI